MRPLPLRLTLEPRLGFRTPTSCDCFEYGFQLRLPRGPALRNGDPLLAAFGARVEFIDVGAEHEEALQSDAFDPARPVKLIPEPFDPAEPDALGVWDADGIRQAGTATSPTAAIVAAGVEAGLEYEGLALWEHSSAIDGRREELGYLVYSPKLVRVSIPQGLKFERPARSTRPRLVLVAGESGDVRWWDPSGDRGPLEAGDVPLSHELRGELDRFTRAFAAARSGSDADAEDHHGFDLLESVWEQEALDSRAVALWRRARSELGRRYVVGYLGPRMRRPVWSPDELRPDEDDDEIPF